MSAVLLKALQALIDKDPQALSLLASADAPSSVDGDVVVFSLLALFELVKAHFPQGFATFQTELYQSNINEQLSTQGWVVDVYQSTGKVHDSLYQLRPL